MIKPSPEKLFPIPFGAEAALYFLPGQYVLQYSASGCQAVKFLGPKAVAAAFSKEAVDSGWLPPGTIRAGVSNAGHYLITFHPPAVREIFVEWGNGSRRKIATWRVALPALVVAGIRSAYYVWAVSNFAGTVHPDLKIARAPFPNLNNLGLVCFGANPHLQVQNGGFARTLETFWAAPFSDHQTNGKCSSEPADVRKLLKQLHDQKATEFPAGELQPMGATLDSAVDRLINRKADVMEDF